MPTCISLGGCLTTALHTGMPPGPRRAPTEGRPQTVAWAEGKPHGQQSEGASRECSMQAVRWPNILTNARGARVAWQWVPGPGGREKPSLSPPGLGGHVILCSPQGPEGRPLPMAPHTPQMYAPSQAQDPATLSSCHLAVQFTHARGSGVPHLPAAAQGMCAFYPLLPSSFHSCRATQQGPARTFYKQAEDLPDRCLPVSQADTQEAESLGRG